MNQEKIELLLFDLCTRIPHGIVVQQSAQYTENHFMYSVADKWKTESHDFKIIGIQGTNTLITDKLKEERTYAKGIVPSHITICIYDNFTKQIAKPYLRSMARMTKEEEKVYEQLIKDVHYKPRASTCNKLISWLKEHYFDDNYLIEQGLALEAPEGMYKNK